MAINLDELIESCGEEFGGLFYFTPDKNTKWILRHWIARSVRGLDYEASTPQEAVLKLLTSLRK